MSDILKRARKGKYGVPAVAAINEMSARACVEAAEETNSPLIILCGLTHNPDINYFGRILNDMATKTHIPVSLILDHSETYEEAIKGIKAGFNTIMVDRSTLPYDENVAQVKELVKIAHAAGVEVEAELGHVGVGENYAVDGSSALTVPEEAVRYVEETGVDCLAVAIGSAHGVYKGEPHLRFDLLEELAAKVPVPLVLHGGSGTGDDKLALACQKGISKVNIANELFRSAYDKIQQVGMEGNKIYMMFPMLELGYKESAIHHMKILGCAGKAWDTKQYISTGVISDPSEA
jgi:fructose-bisphosphate aldolase class II